MIFEFEINDLYVNCSFLMQNQKTANIEDMVFHTEFTISDRKSFSSPGVEKSGIWTTSGGQIMIF